MLFAMRSKNYEQQHNLQSKLLFSLHLLCLTNRLALADSLQVYNVGTNNLKPGAVRSAGLIVYSVILFSPV